jgi:hypothetical protein
VYVKKLWQVWRRKDVYKRLWRRDLMERDNLEDIGIDGKVIIQRFNAVG